MNVSKNYIVSDNSSQEKWRETVVFQNEDGPFTIETVSFSNKKQAPVQFHANEIDNLLVSKKKVLVHQTEKNIFVAEQLKTQEDKIQAAFIWKGCSIEDSMTKERIDFAREQGLVHYINPEQHEGASRIFNPKNGSALGLCDENGTLYEEIPGTSDFVYENGWLISLEEGEKRAFKLVSARISVERISEKVNYTGKVFETIWKIEVYAAGKEKVWEISEEKVATDFLNKLKGMPGISFASGIKTPNSILNFVRQLAASAPTEHVLCDAGWQEVDGHMHYIQDGHFPVGSYTIRTGRLVGTVPGRNGADIFLQAVRLFDDKSLAGPMLTYAVYGVLYRVFIDAGVFPQTVLFLAGPTGCQKSSVAKILFRFFDDEITNSPHNFQSTMGSIDQLVNQGRDGTMMLDDFCPNTGNCDEKDLYRKLERVIRLFGDGSSRKVLDANHESCTVAKAQGGAVITGEIPGRGKSSLLRMLNVEMDYHAINLEVLNEFQAEPKLWSTFIAEFISGIECNYEQVRDFLRDSFGQVRKKGMTIFKDGRVVDHYAVLMTICQLLQYFLQGKNVDKEVVLLLRTQFESGICQTCQYSEDLANDKGRFAYYLEALSKVLDLFVAQIAPDKTAFDKNTSLWGYQGTKGLVYIKADLLEQAVKSNLLERDKLECFMPNKESFGILAENGLIKSYRNGIGKHTYTLSAKTGGVSNRLVGIYQDKLREIVLKLG